MNARQSGYNEQPEAGSVKDDSKQKGRGHGSSGCFVVFITIVIMGFVFLMGIWILSINSERYHERRSERQREYHRDQGHEVIRFDDERMAELQRARRIEHEVHIFRYHPFAYRNNLTVMQEEPTITFTENFPRLDGATAAFPVFAAIAQALYIGLDEYSVEEFVTVSQTDVAYERLINGEIDIFFGAQPSRQQFEMAYQAGVELIMTPVAREAFVFFVHEDNLVDNLSISQIQDIYQRNITNWSQVGGRDERILTFQRPKNSGSQTIMLAMVMDGLPIAEPVLQEFRTQMSDIINYVAINEYRNVSSAIGYSFRYFVTGMHPNDDINILAINGIEPTIENVKNGVYPFIINVYAVTAGSVNENVDTLIDWILSDQGQRFIELCGIVPIRAESLNGQ